MNALVFLIPCALGLALTGLAAFMWSLRSGQFEDPAGAAARILIDDEDPPAEEPTSTNSGHAGQP